MSVVVDVRPPTVVDWPDLERRARRVAVAKAPLVPVAVGFWPEGRHGPKLTATWQGQVYGSLAVTEIGAGPPECLHAHAVIRGYQLVHVPTGTWMRSHLRRRPLQMLVLALGAVGVDWGRLDLDLLTTLSVERGAALARILFEWDARYGG